MWATDGPAPENDHAARRPARRGRAERARGRALRRPRHRRAAVALRGRRRAPGLPAAPLLPRPNGDGGRAAPRGAARAADDAGRRDLRRLAGHERGHDPARARGRPVGGRLRRARARGGRPRAHAGRPRARRLRRGRPRPRGHRPRRAPRRLLAGRHVLLPGGRLPPQRRAGVADHVRQPGRHPPGDAVRAPRGAGLGAGGPDRRRLSQLGAARLGQPQRLPAARSGQVAAQPDRVHPAAARPRGAAAARGPAAVPRGRRLGGVAGPGDGRLPRPVHRPQPDARGRLRRSTSGC